MAVLYFGRALKRESAGNAAQQTCCFAKLASQPPNKNLPCLPANPAALTSRAMACSISATLAAMRDPGPADAPKAREGLPSRVRQGSSTYTGGLAPPGGVSGGDPGSGVPPSSGLRRAAMPDGPAQGRALGRRPGLTCRAAAAGVSG